MNEIEHRRVHAYPEREHDHGRNREARHLKQPSDRELEIPDRAADPDGDWRHVAAGVLHLLEPAELQARLPPGLPFVHAGGDVIRGEALEMIAKLGIELTIEVLTMPESPPPVHSAPPSA